jgi:hypothetical protein
MYWTGGGFRGSTQFVRWLTGSEETILPPDETIFRGGEDGLKQTLNTVDFDQTTRFGHVGHSHQLILPPLLPVEFG